MQLTLAYHPVNSIGFGERLSLDGTALTVSQDELRANVLEDPLIDAVDFAVRRQHRHFSHFVAWLKLTPVELTRGDRRHGVLQSRAHGWRQAGVAGAHPDPVGSATPLQDIEAVGAIALPDPDAGSKERQHQQRQYQGDRGTFQECSIASANCASVGSDYALAMRSA